MIISNLNEFYDFISKNDIIEKKIDLENHELIISKFKSSWVTFNNCEINCNSLIIRNIENNDLAIEFKNCTFNCDIVIDNCKIERLQFLNINKLKSLKIFGGYSEEKKTEIKYFKFNNSIDDKKEEAILSTYFNFERVFFKKYFEFNNINNINGIFNFSNNVIGDELYINNSSCVFHNSKLSNVNFFQNEFNTYTSFKDSKFHFNINNFINTGSQWSESKFLYNIFQKVDFSEIHIHNLLLFNNCDFNGTTWFEDCKSIETANVKFVACKFEKYSLFDNSKFNGIEILRTKFLDKASFENLRQIILFYIKLHLLVRLISKI